ncbi:MAG: helix-turn-helix domain-containing protein [Muribaculaceae bacterium]|nr:helix-turn-helix domain-containing protein [Muribaculaceae bacterium]
MPRYDISRLRKEKGMSQSELANLLQMTQSFLSAIENGKSPLPVEKEEKLCEIFSIPDLNAYIVGKRSEGQDKGLTEMTDSDLFNQLLSRFHKQAHSEESEHHHRDHHQRIEELEEKVERLFNRNDALMQRNDFLSDVNDRLRNEIDSYRLEIEKLRDENYSLRKQLLKEDK